MENINDVDRCSLLLDQLAYVGQKAGKNHRLVVLIAGPNVEIKKMQPCQFSFYIRVLSA